MNTREQLIKKVENAKRELAKAEEELSIYYKKGNRKQFEKNDRYYYIGTFNAVLPDTWRDASQDIARFKAYNTFDTVEQAQKEIDRRLCYNKLKELATRLNNGEIMDWSNPNQIKGFILYDNLTNSLSLRATATSQPDSVCCLEPHRFLEMAKREIGEEVLTNYFRSMNV